MSLVHKVSDLFEYRTYPKNWVTCELMKISTIQNGFPFKSNLFNSNKKGVPLLRIRDIVDSKIKTFYDGDYLEDFVVHKGDLIVGMDGDFNHNLWNNDSTLLNQRVCRIFPQENIINKSFLYYGIGEFLKVINNNTSAVTVKHLSSKSIGEIPFPLPPLLEQERIVAKLDKIFYKIDAIRKRIDNLEKLKSNFFSSIFYESTGLTYLADFLVERSERVGANWEKFSKVGVSAKKGVINLDVGGKKSFEKYKIVEPGDIIYNTMRINIGSIAIYEGKEPAITSPDYVVFKVKNASKYLILNYLKSEAGRRNVSSLTTGSVRSRLYFKNLVNIPFPEITSARHKSAESILKWFESSLAKMHVIDINLLHKLTEGILHKAFKGELVPQLPTDGEAKDLLKQIVSMKTKSKGK